MNSTRPATRGPVRFSWWRAHHGLPQHAKWRAVSRAAGVPVSIVFHIAACLLDTASRSHPRGSIADFKAFDCAGVVDAAVDDVERVLVVLRDIHWIEGHMLADWDERQPQREDQGAAERKARERAKGHAMSRNVTHEMRDKPECHAPEAGHGVTSADVTKLSAPDKERKITTTFLVAEGDQQPARSLATAPPSGALAREPPTVSVAKRPSEMSRGELDAILASRKRGTTEAA